MHFALWLVLHANKSLGSPANLEMERDLRSQCQRQNKTSCCKPYRCNMRSETFLWRWMLQAIFQHNFIYVLCFFFFFYVLPASLFFCNKLYEFISIQYPSIFLPPNVPLPLLLFLALTNYPNSCPSSTFLLSPLLPLPPHISFQLYSRK